jgi:hypothetical protein
MKDEATYHLRIRNFTPNGVKRIDASVHNRFLSASKQASNSLDLPHGSTFEIDGNRLWFRFPLSVFGDTTDLMLSADSILGQVKIDKTAWRVFHLKQ